ncbi:MAG: DUF1385 domain-containing protein [Candidatus Bathyarchaeia archaeon]
MTAKGAKEPSLAFGGQAVIEGIMIRSRKHMVICVRQPNNEILKKVEEIKSISDRHKVLKLPFIRGIAALFETLYLGVKGLLFSANANLDEEEKLSTKEMVITVVFALALAIFLFTVLPLLTTNFLSGVLKLEGITFYMVESIIRIGILLIYLAVISLFGEFRRVLQYHGAEHTAINAYEAGVELNIQNAKNFSRFHPRCGTSFIFIVTLITIIMFLLIPRNVGFPLNIAYRILLIPVISAISYEILKISDKYRNSLVMKILVAPGLALQHFTTRKPDDEMIEVAIEAVKEVDRLSKAIS